MISVCHKLLRVLNTGLKQQYCGKVLALYENDQVQCLGPCMGPQSLLAVPKGSLEHHCYGPKTNVINTVSIKRAILIHFSILSFITLQQIKKEMPLQLP